MSANHHQKHLSPQSARSSLVFLVPYTPLIKEPVYRLSSNPCFLCTDYIKRFRYCHYLGKYFCSSCHSNFLEVIPANVIRKWDFTKYPLRKWYTLEPVNSY